MIRRDEFALAFVVLSLAAALAGLSSCGGGGGGSRAPGDQVVITPPGSGPPGTMPADRHSDTPAGATDIAVGRAVEGNIDSLEDEDYFRFTPPETGIYLIRLDSDIPGVELSLLDESGNVIATRQTKSIAGILTIASLGTGVIMIMLEDAVDFEFLEKLPTEAELYRDLALLGVDSAFKAVVSKLVLPFVKCPTQVCEVVAGEAFGYTIDVLKLPFSERLEKLVFPDTQGCQARVVFNERGFFTPSRYFSTEFDTASYSGACINGVANGQGTLTASDTGRSLTYTGAWVDGEPRGLGDWRIGASDFGVLRYNGEWRDGQPNGQGTGIVEFVNGNDWRYTGAWVGGNPHGRGTWTALTDGDRYRYVGEFRNGLQHGRGTETNAYANGDRERLVGEFRNDVLWNGTSIWNGETCRVVNGEYEC